MIIMETLNQTLFFCKSNTIRYPTTVERLQSHYSLQLRSIGCFESKS